MLHLVYFMIVTGTILRSGCQIIIAIYTADRFIGVRVHIFYHKTVALSVNPKP